MLKINSNKSRWLLSSVLAVILIAFLFTATGFAASDNVQEGDFVVINSKTFPDPGLRSCMLDMYPEGEIPQSELSSMKSLDISGKGIKDLTGVTLFENLETLNCSNNNITKADFNTCFELKKLKRLDLSDNRSLESLTVNGYYSENIDTDEYRSFINEENYVLEQLDVSGCTSLTDLDCSSNMLKTLEIDGCTALKKLNCSSNNLKSLNVSGCTSLTELSCGSNMLKTLDVDDCKALMYLSCGSNMLKTLGIDGCTALTTLYCQDNELTSLDLGNQTRMIDIDCSNNKLSTLDISKVKFTDTGNVHSLYHTDSLYYTAYIDSYGIVNCSNNKLTSLKLPANEKISDLDCSNNDLTRLDLSKVIFIPRNGYFSQLTYDKDKVKKLSLPKYSIGKLSDKVYKGTPVEYSLEPMNIKMNAYKLKDDDKIFGFTCKYKNNNSIGTATVTIKDSNGASGTQTFRIVPAKAAIKNVKHGKKKITVTIKKQPGGVKYQISVKKKGSKAAAKKYTVKKGTTKTIKRLKKNAKYTVKVRAFKKVKGKTYWGRWSKAKTIRVR